MMRPSSNCAPAPPAGKTADDGAWERCGEDGTILDTVTGEAAKAPVRWWESSISGSQTSPVVAARQVGLVHA